MRETFTENSHNVYTIIIIIIVKNNSYYCVLISVYTVTYLMILSTNHVSRRVFHTKQIIEFYFIFKTDCMVFNRF